MKNRTLDNLINRMETLLEPEAPFDVAKFIDDAEAMTRGEFRLGLPFGWFKVNPHPKQAARWNATTRFTMTCAGRRSNKTQYAIRKAVLRAVAHTGGPGRILMGAPTLGQSRDIWWERLKAHLPAAAIRYINISRGIIELWNGVQFVLIGNENRKRAEGGLPVIGACLDEYADCDPQMYTATLRPMLMDTQGWLEVLGKPTGRNHYYQHALRVQADTSGLWSYHHWTSEEVLPYYLGEAAEAEIASIKAETDTFTYNTEYRASWEEYGSIAYYSWSRENLCDFEYDPHLPLMLNFDFNIRPGTATAMQSYGGKDHIVKEFYIPEQSNTERICNLITPFIKDHKHEIRLYGDPSGGAGGSAKLAGSDWDIIARHIPRAYDCVIHSAPAERVRIVAVNKQLATTGGVRTLFVNRKCVKTIEDFEGVKLIENTGDVDKKSTPLLTHLTDGIGYNIIGRFAHDSGAMAA